MMLRAGLAFDPLPVKNCSSFRLPEQCSAVASTFQQQTGRITGGNAGSREMMAPTPQPSIEMHNLTE
jgi:hypothetical protein